VTGATAESACQVGTKGPDCPVKPRQLESPSHASDSAQSVDAEKYANLALQTPIAVTSAILAAIDSMAPTTAAALAYMTAVNSNDVCGKAAQAFLARIANGGSLNEAAAYATSQYISDYNSGLKVEPGTPCEAADSAWRAAEAAGKDPVVASAIAFMESWPGTKEGVPCAVSGKDYVNALLQGASHLEATKLAAKSFGEALKSFAAQGKELRDPACASAAKAFFNALTEKPSDSHAVAMIAFLDKALAASSFKYDPVCWKASKAFLESYSTGANEQASNNKAAEAFLDEIVKAGFTMPADSPCAAAARAYTKNIQSPVSPATKAAMDAFMDKATASGNREVDPVCAAAAKAYW
jgi:hypothetical protein